MTTTLRLDDRVAVVTGAGGGLGRAYALELARLGAKVVVNDLGVARNGDGAAGDGPGVSPAAAVAAEIVAAGGEAVADTGSVADPDQAAGIVARAVETWGRLDIVVNNAGVTGRGAFSPPEVWDRVLATHLHGTVNVLRAAFPHFTERGYGRVVNTASSSFLGTPHSGDYAAAKGGVIGLSRVLASDHRDTDIRVNVLMPVAYTRMTAAVPDEVYRSWLERHFPAERVASFVPVLCHESLDVTGETFLVGGGRASRVLFQTTAGYFDPSAGPDEYLANFDRVMAGEDARVATSGQGDLARYAELLGDRGPF